MFSNLNNQFFRMKVATESEIHRMTELCKNPVVQHFLKDVKGFYKENHQVTEQATKLIKKQNSDVYNYVISLNKKVINYKQLIENCNQQLHLKTALDKSKLTLDTLLSVMNDSSNKLCREGTQVNDLLKQIENLQDQLQTKEYEIEQMKQNQDNNNQGNQRDSDENQKLRQQIIDLEHERNAANEMCEEMKNIVEKVFAAAQKECPQLF